MLFCNVDDPIYFTFKQKCVYVKDNKLHLSLQYLLHFKTAKNFCPTLFFLLRLSCVCLQYEVDFKTLP